MALVYLNTELFHGAVMHACQWIIAQREALNAINVFPVADRDTGNNMASTASAIMHHSEQKNTLSAVVKGMADASILGARGNSGMIFSQFFNGLSEELDLPTQLNTQQFARLITQAVQSVRAAILNPVEGTILTVMEAWAKSLSHHAQVLADFKRLMHETKHDVQMALESTRHMLTALQEAHVVDAGAQGFSLFIQGFAAFLADPHVLDKKTTDAFVMDTYHTHDDVLSDYVPQQQRYCTEAVIAGAALDKVELQKALATHGDSIVLTGNANLCRVHVHAHEPARVFETLKTWGTIQYPKVDDMLRQYQVMHAPQSRIALVTDSGATLPHDFIDEYQVHWLTHHVHWNQHELLDQYSIDRHTFYDDLARPQQSFPTTSFPSLHFMEEKIRHLSTHYEDVLIFSLSQALSGAYEAMSKIAARYPRVHVIDSRHVSGSQGLLIQYAAKLMKEGAAIQDIIEAVLQKRSKVKFFAMIHDLKALVRSGRVHKLAGAVAQFVGMRPIITLDDAGKAVICDRAMSQSRAFTKLIDHAQRDGALEEYCILHTGARAQAEALALETTAAFGFKPAFIEPASTSIGIHAGYGSVALATTRL